MLGKEASHCQVDGNALPSAMILFGCREKKFGARHCKLLQGKATHRHCNELCQRLIMSYVVPFC